MRIPFRIALFLVLAGSLPARAEPPSPLAAYFAQAWARQPAAAALADRERAQAARVAVAEAWTAAAPALEIAGRTDRFNRDRGAGEVELGVALPLWLPGERDGSQRLAQATNTLERERLIALQWQLAGELRERWWRWHLAREEVRALAGQVEAAQTLRDDVLRRVKAGDLAPADGNLAEGNLASLQADAADADAQAEAAALQLTALLGELPLDAQAHSEIAAAERTAADGLERHPALRVLQAQAESAAQRQQLARVQRSAAPELMIATRRERSASGDPVDQSWSLGLRVPLDAGARREGVLADAAAEHTEAQLALVRERERLQLGLRQALAAERAVQRRLQASEVRERLANENLAWYDQAFRLGESDLPTRLRAATEAFAATRAVQRARLQLAASISATRQAMGLLPE